MSKVKSLLNYIKNKYEISFNKISKKELGIFMWRVCFVSLPSRLSVDLFLVDFLGEALGLQSGFLGLDSVTLEELVILLWASASGYINMGVVVASRPGEAEVTLLSSFWLPSTLESESTVMLIVEPGGGRVEPLRLSLLASSSLLLSSMAACGNR